MARLQSAETVAAKENTPYWLILLAIVDSILPIAIALLILKRIAAGKKLGKGAKAGICVGIASLPWWHWCSGPCSSAAAAHRQRQLPLRAQPLPRLPKAPQLRKKQRDGSCLWNCPRPTQAAALGCHIYLMEDGTFSVAYDYTADNAGIEAAKGTYVDNGDGTLDPDRSGWHGAHRRRCCQQGKLTFHQHK